MGDWYPGLIFREDGKLVIIRSWTLTSSSDIILLYPGASIVIDVLAIMPKRRGTGMGFHLAANV